MVERDMKIKNKIRKAATRIAKEDNNRVNKIFQENKYDFQTPYQGRRGRRGVKKPKYKDHK